MFRFAVIVGFMLLADSVAVSSLGLRPPQPVEPAAVLPVMLLTNGDGSVLTSVALTSPPDAQTHFAPGGPSGQALPFP